MPVIFRPSYVHICKSAGRQWTDAEPMQSSEGKSGKTIDTM